MDREQVIQEFRQVRVADVGSAVYVMQLESRLMMDPGVLPLKAGYDMRGFAFTARYIPSRTLGSPATAQQIEALLAGSRELMQEGGRGAGLDPSGIQAKQVKAREMLTQITPGDVLVIDNAARPHHLWGSAINLEAIARGVVGVLLDGTTHDVVDLREQELPIFCRGSSPRRRAPEIELAATGEPIVCGSIQVRPGDFICGDDDGIIVIPENLIEPVLALAKHANKMDTQLQQGEWLDKTIQRYGPDWQTEIRKQTHRNEDATHAPV